MHSLLRDLRLAARSLRKAPGLVIIATFALAMGIALTTTMFSIIYGALIKGLPYENADRIAVVNAANPSREIRQSSVSIHDFRDIAAQQRSFEQLGGYYSGTVNVSGTERAERFSGTWVTPEVIPITGVRPLLGRGIGAEDARPGGERVAVLGYAMWRDRYGSDPNVLGKTIRANGVPFTVVGVMPEGFLFPDNSALWLPLQADPLASPRGEGQGLNVLGLLRTGGSQDAANAELAGIAKRLEGEHKANDGWSFNVQPWGKSQIPDEPRRLLYTMLGAVFLVLLIACANVANLLLDRAAHKTKEVGIRTALGASRMAVLRQFLAEAVVLSLVGAALGVGLAYFGIDAFNRAIADTDPPFWLDIKLHPPVLAFAIATALVASVASGFLPAFQSSRSDINEILKDESRGASSLHIGRMSRALVMFEIALSCGLLVAAGLMIKSVTRLSNMDPGFRTTNIFTARIGFPATYTDTAMQKQFYVNLEQRLAAIPGAQGAAIASGLPGVNMGGSNFAIEGKAYAKDRDLPRTRTLAVTPGWFQTFEVTASAGRLFNPGDRDGSLPVAVVNRAFVDKHLEGKDPIGRRVRMGNLESTRPWVTIVGVVPNIYTGDHERPQDAAIFAPLSQNHSNFVSLAVRTATAPMSVTQQVRDAVAGLDRDIPLYWVYSMEEALERPTWFIRIFGGMFIIFGGIALFLAGVGLYAVMAFSVSRRTREVGIRMALGAESGHVVRMIFRQGAWQMAIGLTAGLLLAFGVSQLLSTILYDVQPRDPAVFGAVVGVLVAAGMLACYVPSRRATRVDPLVALRSD